MTFARTLPDAAVDSTALGSVLAVCAVSVFIELAMLLVARRRAERAGAQHVAALRGDWVAVRSGFVRPSRVLELGAALGPLLVLAAMALVVSDARSTLLEGTRSPRLLDEGAPRLWEAFVVERAAIPLGMVGSALAGLLACAVAALSANARARAASLLYVATRVDRSEEAAAFARYPARPAGLVTLAALGFVLLSLGPLWAASITATAVRLGALEAVAEAPIPKKREALERAEDAVGRALERGFRCTAIASALAGLLAGSIAWRTSPARARARVLGYAADAPARRHDIATTSATLAASIAIVVAAEPMRRDNAMPWPERDGRGLGLTFDTPALEGPDAIEAGPLLAIEPGRVTLDGAPPSQRGLASHRSRYAILHPGEEPPGAIIACDAGASGARVRDALAEAARAGYRRATFAFEVRRTSERPFLGAVVHRRVSGARVRLVDAPTDGSALHLRPDESGSCAALAERIVGARREGRDVELEVGTRTRGGAR